MESFFYLILNLPNFLIKNKSNWWQFATKFKYGFLTLKHKIPRLILFYNFISFQILPKIFFLFWAKINSLKVQIFAGPNPTYAPYGMSHTVWPIRYRPYPGLKLSFQLKKVLEKKINRQNRSFREGFTP